MMFSRTAYDFGKKFAGFDQSEADREVQRLGAANAKLELEVGQLSGNLAQVERQMQMERATYEDLVKQVKALTEGTFLDRRENVLVFGNPGSGKTHLLSALGQELIRRGRRVVFSTCARLVQDLLRAKQELRLGRAIRKLAYYEALVIDDLGYVQQSREEMEVLFTLLAERYERGSVLITSNLPFSKWEAIFKDPMTTASAIDRLVHHSVILELNIPSYRMEQAKKKKAEEEQCAGDQ